MATPKEAIYDEQIAPLMAQIIAICKEHKIANLCSFDLGPDPDEDGVHLACTTAMLSDEFEPDDRHLAALREIYQQPSFLAFTITTKEQPDATR